MKEENVWIIQNLTIVWYNYSVSWVYELYESSYIEFSEIFIKY